MSTYKVLYDYKREFVTRYHELDLYVQNMTLAPESYFFLRVNENLLFS